MFYVMFLGWPLDFCEERLFRQVVSRFGVPLNWVDRPMKEAYILIRCLVKEHLRVPRSTILEQVCRYGGRGRSWTMPTMLLDGDLDGNLPFEEEVPEGTRNRHAPLPPPQAEDGWVPWGQPAEGNDNVLVGWPVEEQQQPEPQVQMPDSPPSPLDHLAPNRPLGLRIIRGPAASDSINSDSFEQVDLCLGPSPAPRRRALPGISFRSHVRDSGALNLDLQLAREPFITESEHGMDLITDLDDDLQFALLEQHTRTSDPLVEPEFDPTDPYGKKRIPFVPGNPSCASYLADEPIRFWGVPAPPSAQNFQ